MNFRGLFIFTAIVSVTLRVSPAIAQISPDGSLPTTVTSTNGRDFLIGGGTKRGTSLFHSFDEFSIPDNGSATFTEFRNGVRNIIGRITGDSPSIINGLIRTSNGANLFLINPNGIDIGVSARLDMDGSFLASTAESLIFEDGTVFRATESSPPVLTASIPVGLQMGSNPGSISLNTPNFSLPADQDVVLVSGSILLNGVSTNALDSNLQLGGFPPSETVTLEVGSRTIDLRSVGSQPMTPEDEPMPDPTPDPADSEDASPGETSTVLDRNTPDQTTPDRNTPDQTTPDQTTPDQTTPDQTTSNQTTSNQTTSNQTTSNQTTSNRTTSNRNASDRSDETGADRPDTIQDPDAPPDGNRANESSTSNLRRVFTDPLADRIGDRLNPSEADLLAITLQTTEAGTVRLASCLNILQTSSIMSPHFLRQRVAVANRAEGGTLYETVASAAILNGTARPVIEPTCSPTVSNALWVSEPGGLPETPTRDLGGDAVWRDLRFLSLFSGAIADTPSSPDSESASPTPIITDGDSDSPLVPLSLSDGSSVSEEVFTPIVEASGWVVSDTGQIRLVAPGQLDNGMRESAALHHDGLNRNRTRRE